MPASVDDDFWVAGSSTRARRKSQAYGEPLWGDAPKWEGPCELVVEPPIKSRYFESFLATFFASVEAATLLVDDVDLTLTPAHEGKARRLRLAAQEAQGLWCIQNCHSDQGREQGQPRRRAPVRPFRPARSPQSPREVR